MPRPKQFSRQSVLEKALPVFWRHGFADTSLQELERATGVNKSGLYAEFDGKEDLFLASLRYYFEEQDKRGLLTTQPLGWRNIERFLRLGPGNAEGRRGCFCVNSMRDLSILPPRAATLVARHMAYLKHLVAQNIEAEGTRMDAASIADMVLTFFTGLSMEHHVGPSRASVLGKIRRFMQVIRSL
jgi:TetR/AcrR family transcriptional regulator, copper-responsive repressor